ncbi:hypothetical protein [Vibrio mediterranei]|uniref:hypothetical protein n=1 Tax=Vibrio mediterranei TaxID=689 RepID=UPI00148B6858|nr:hypothetical protein [Vibrio mediterranei]NOI26184.1 hypothetical protein [Vibrio mediterranei]
MRSTLIMLVLVVVLAVALLTITQVIDAILLYVEIRNENYEVFLSETADCYLTEKVQSGSAVPEKLVYDCNGAILIWQK